MKPDVKTRWRDPVYVITLAVMLLVLGVGIYLSTTPVFEGPVENLLLAWMTASLAALSAVPSRSRMPGRGIPLMLMLISFGQLALALHRMF